MIAGIVDLQTGASAAELVHRYGQLVRQLGVLERSQSAGAIFGATVTNSPASPVLVAADLRLDGRAHLLRELGLGEVANDVEIIGACWRRWGAACVDHLSGDFAFAMWCPRTRKLWLARDVLGQRPLFVRRMGGHVAFSSLLKPLRMLSPRTGPDAIAMADHLLCLPGDPHRTAWRDVERVPAGHLLCFRDLGSPPIARPYFTLVPAEHTDGLSDEDWIEGFRERFNCAVKDRLSTSEPIAATVSGGLDSSAVLATAIRLREGSELRGYAARFSMTPECDEGRHLDELRTLQGLQLRELDASPESPLSTFTGLLPWLDEPILIQNLHLWSTLYAAVQADGVRIVLDGHDGDSALGRSASTDARALPTRSWLSWTVQQLRRMRHPPSPAPQPASAPAVEWLNPDFASATDAAQRWQAFDAARCKAAADGMRARHAWQLNSGYAVYATERLSSLGRKYGIEPRHPFYDARLLRWCLALPAHMKQRDGYSRWVLRTALEGVLPDNLRWRKDKTSLSAQFHRAFGGADAALVESILDDDTGALSEYLELQKIRALWRTYRTEPTDRASTALWSVATLALWLRENKT